MKKVLLLASICITMTPLFGQICNQMMSDAEAAAKDGEFRKAILKYIAAKNCNPALSKKADENILAVFDEIERLKKQAENDKAFSIQALKETQEAKIKIEKNILTMSELISRVTDELQSEKAAGIIGFDPVKHEVLNLLLPYLKYIAENTKFSEEQWEEAKTHFQLGRSQEATGNSIEAAMEYKIAFEKSISVIKVLQLKKKAIPDELYITLMSTAVFHSWHLMDKNEIKRAESVLLSTRDLINKDKLNSAGPIYGFARLENALSRLMSEQRNEEVASIQKLATELAQSRIDLTNQQVMQTPDSISLDYRFADSVYKVYSNILKTVSDSLMNESKSDASILLHQKSAVDLTRKAVDLEKNNLVYKNTLAVYLNNLRNNNDSTITEQLKSKLRQEACEISYAVDNTDGAGSIALSSVVDCIYNKSFESDVLSREERLDILFAAKKRLDDIIHMDPSTTKYRLLRSRINNRISDIEDAKKNNEARLKYFLEAQKDWRSLFKNKPVLPEDLTMLRNIYEGMRVTASRIDDKEVKKSFFKNIATAIDTSASFFRNVFPLILIATDSYTQLSELLDSTQNGKDSALLCLSKAVKFLDQTEVLNKFSSYDESYEWLCKAYGNRVKLYCKAGDIERAITDYGKITKLFAPILERYPFDFYLRQHFNTSNSYIGELLCKKGRYQDARPYLEYASNWGIRSSTNLLAQMYREGNLGVKDAEKAKQLEDLAKGQSMKRFTIPCNFGGIKAPFDVYVSALPKKFPYRGVDDQAEWLWQARGGIIPKIVRESFIKLEILARKNNVSFPDLCVYALEAANEQKDNEQIDSLNKSVQLATSKNAKIDLYKQITRLYEKRITKDLTKSSQNEQAAESYINYGRFLEQEGDLDKALIKYKRAYELNPENSNALIYGAQVNFRKNKGNVDSLMNGSSRGELLGYIILYLKSSNKKNADIITRKLLSEKPDPNVRDEINKLYANRGYDNFNELFMSDKDNFEDDRNYFLKKATSARDTIERINNYKKVIRLDEALLKSNADMKAKVTTANHYNSLGWYYLLTGQIANAKSAIESGLKLDGTNVYLLSNVPHILLFSNKKNKALDLYLKLKDLPFDNKSDFPTFRHAFLSDFRDFKKIGITHPALDNIRNLIEK